MATNGHRPASQAAHDATVQRYKDYVATSFVAAVEPVAIAKAEGITYEELEPHYDAYEKIFGMKPPMDIWGQGPAAENPWMQAMANWRKMFGMG